VEAFTRILERDPGNVEATEGLLEAADGLSQAGQLDAAIAAYETVWRARPEEARALQGLGQAYEAKGDWGGAAGWYERWVQAAPDNLDALLASGWAEYKLEHYDNAVAQFSRVSELAPDQPTGFLGLGRVYLAQGDYANSLKNAELSLKLASEGSLEQDQAIQLLKDLAEADSDAGPLLVLSEWYAGRGDSAALQEINQRILERVPYPVDVNLGNRIRFLGYEFRELSDGQVQIDLYFQATTALDADYALWLHTYVYEDDVVLLPPERQQYGFDNWGHPMSYPTSQWVEGAIYRDRTVREVAPGEYHFRFGVWLPDSETYLTTPDDPEKGAIDLGWQLVNATAVHARVLSRYGWHRLESGDSEGARKAFEAVLTKEPDNPDALLGASAVYGALGENKRLFEITDRLLSLISNRQDVLVGEAMHFIGYEIQTLENGQVQLDLYFQVTAPIDADYEIWLHVFVQEEDTALLPPERQQYGFDNWSHPMSYPTSQWVEGAIYRDRIVRELLPGEYHFRLGVWLSDPETRLATPDDPMGAIDLGWYTVSGE
jgi:tetratricopeptide (TPR) repeat protein